LATKNSKLMVEAQLFIDIVALSHVLLGLELDSILNLILTRGLLRFERRFGFGVCWGKMFFMISCSQGTKGTGRTSAGLLSHDDGLPVRNTETEKERDGEKQGGPAWKKKGGWPAGLTQEKLGFGPWPDYK
jgi:hypothetical protein